MDFATGILESIKNDQEFKFNAIVMAVVESLQNKKQNYSLEEDYLIAVKESLSSVNAYLKSQRIDDIIVKVEEKLGTAAGTNVHTKINRMYYEIDMPGALSAIRESQVYAEPVVKKYVDMAMLEMQSNKAPYFKYLPGFLGTLSIFRTNETVNNWVTKFETYINENRKKLMLLETVHYLDGTGNGFYNGVTEKLKPFIVSNEFNSSKIMLEMKQFTTIPVIKELMVALQTQETNETEQFHLGVGDGATKVYNYIGPVLKEENNMMFFIDSSFINLSSIPLEEKNVARELGKTGDLIVRELTPEYVFESKSEYYQIAKSFEYLGFNVKDRGVNTKLRNIKVDFNVNEAGNLDLYLNDQHIEDPKKVNFHQMFVLENNYIKNCSTILFNNMDKIYNVEFVKMLVNEQRNAAAIVINVNEEYYVYDFVDSKKRDIYKADGFRLQKFIFEKFGYDVRALFNIQINDVKSKVNSIDEKKREIENAILQLEGSYKEISETMAKPGVKAADIELLKGLSEKIEKEMVTLKNAFILLEDERSTALGQPQTQAPADFKLGDNVMFGENQSGRIVAVPTDDKSKDYMIYTAEGRTEKAQKEGMTKSEGKPQATNESKKGMPDGKWYYKLAKDDKPHDKKAGDWVYVNAKDKADATDQLSKMEDGLYDKSSLTNVNPHPINEAKNEKPQAQEKEKEQAQEKETQAQEKAQEKETKAQEKAQEKEDNAQKKETEEKEQSQETNQPQAQEKSQEQAQEKNQPQAQEQGIIGGQAQPKETKSMANFKGITGELGELRSAIDTVRPEVRDKFTPLTGDLDTLIKQAGELERLHDEMGNIKGTSDKADFAKVEKKFDKITTELENLTKELTAEFGKGAQQVVVSESLIGSAYDKYIGVVTGVADKLTAKVSNIVKKLSGEVIDLDADIKVINARAYAAKAKEGLGAQTPANEIPVAGAQPAAQAAQPAQTSLNSQTIQSVQSVQPAQPGQPQELHNAQGPEHQAQQTQQQQAQEHEIPGAQSQEDEKKKMNEALNFYSREQLEAMSDEELARECAETFGVSESEMLADMDDERENRIDDLIDIYQISARSRGENAN